MRFQFLLFITGWIVLLQNHGTNGKVEVLNSDEFKILSNQIQSLKSSLQSKDAKINELQDQVKDLSIRRQDHENKTT